LKEWGDATFFYPFGRDLGQGALASFVQGAPPTNIYDASQTIGVFRTAYKEFGEAFVSAIVADMRAVGYGISTVKLIAPTTVVVSGPIQLSFSCLAVQEDNLRSVTEQIDMSQGMFRTLSILIHLNFGMFSKRAGCVIIDDIGEPTVTEIIQHYKTGDIATQTYLGGLLAGLKWANAKRRTEGIAPMYCAPDGLAITTQQGADILARFAVKIGGINRPAGMIMVFALADVFPCR
jgi:hypothetical protein